MPESPRWMFIHARAEDAERLVGDIERQVMESAGVTELKEPKKAIKVREQETVGFLTIAKTVFGAYPRRAVVGLSLFIGQAFLYNAVFFTYALVLGTFYGVKREAGEDGLDRRTLGERVNCGYWGPGRFRQALSVAQQRGEIRAASHGRYVAQEQRVRAAR